MNSFSIALLQQLRRKLPLTPLLQPHLSSHPPSYSCTQSTGCSVDTKSTKNRWCNASLSSLPNHTPTFALSRFAGLNCSNAISKFAASAGISRDSSCSSGLRSVLQPRIRLLTEGFSTISRSYSSARQLLPTSSDGIPRKLRTLSNCCDVFPVFIVENRHDVPQREKSRETSLQGSHQVTTYRFCCCTTSRHCMSRSLRYCRQAVRVRDSRAWRHTRWGRLYCCGRDQSRRSASEAWKGDERQHLRRVWEECSPA